jgi:CHAT domain-containing protein
MLKFRRILAMVSKLRTKLIAQMRSLGRLADTSLPRAMGRRLYSWFGVLFFASLVLCLWVQVGIGQPLVVQSSLQTGLQHFQNGNILKAIQIWEPLVESSSQSESEAGITAQKYLARAYQQTGKFEQAISLLGRISAYYQRSNNWQESGRMLTEQAQLYSAFGQHRRAIDLLCGMPRDTLLQDQKTSALLTPCDRNSAVELAQRNADPVGEAAALGSLGNVYRLKGDYAGAIACLEKSLTIAKRLNNSTYRFAAFNGLGNTYASLAKRNYRQSQYAKQSADEIDAEKFRQDAHRYDQTAIAYFTESLTLAQTQQDPMNELRALLNLAVSHHRSGNAVARTSTPTLTRSTSRSIPTISRSALSGSALSGSALSGSALLDRANAILDRLPNSREKAFAMIRLSSLWQQTTLPIAESDLDPGTYCFSQDQHDQAKKLLLHAIAIAQTIQDSESIAFGLGRLGHLYECQHKYSEALKFTQQAQLHNSSQDNRYLWEWQAGRILHAQGNPKLAISAYESAVQTLNGLKADIAIASRDFQFDFRDTVEPVYRELTALYLSQLHPSQTRQNQPSTQSLNTSLINTALKTIDDLRLAEVQNYLGDDCAIPIFTKPTNIINSKTAVLSTVLLKDQVAVMVSLSGDNKNLKSQLYWIPADSSEVTETINLLRRQLEKRSDLSKTYLATAQKVYGWLIKPFAETLQQAKIETLVFIQDGLLRSVPMAALHDGKQFLIEQYAVATTLSLALNDPTQLDPRSLKVLGLGITKPSVVEGPIFFDPLGYVKSELSKIKTLLPDSTILLDEKFTRDRLRQELQQGNFPVVHVATHGKFGIDSRDTFLVTGRQSDEPLLDPSDRGIRQRSERVTRGSVSSGTTVPKTYNEKLTINQLYHMVRDVRRGKALELLTLTACETAVGSDRDALGIAGIALQAGARSAVASLWQVDDQSTAQLITRFYKNLHQGMSRANALQLSQKSWLKDYPNTHPGYWAALILVGNWL